MKTIEILLHQANTRNSINVGLMSFQHQTNIAYKSRACWLLSEHFCTLHNKCVFIFALTATLYGQGAYFARDASYSASDKYSRPDTSGNKHMFLCSVLTGDFTVGKSDMKDNPIKDSSVTPPTRYDSVTDNVTDPAIFVIFSDTQAYPKYLATF